MSIDCSLTEAQLRELIAETYPGIEYLGPKEKETAIKHILHLRSEGLQYMQRKETLAIRILFEKWGPYFCHLSDENQQHLVLTALSRASQKPAVGDQFTRLVFLDHNTLPAFYVVNGVTYYHCGYGNSGQLEFEPYYAVMQYDELT